MECKPDKQSDIPIYKQIADYIQKWIAYGENPPGSSLLGSDNGYIRLTYGRAESESIPKE